MNIIESNLQFNGELTKRNTTNRIILHHSAVAVTVLQSVETIHNYHKNTKKWAGIGYHYYIRKDGNIYTGRPDNTVGAHAGNNNTDSIGVCFEGDFNQETMGQTQLEAGKELIAYLKEKYNINKIQAHKDVNQTSCPGKNFPFNEIAEGKIEEQVTSNTTSTETTKSIIDLANEVIAGKYGVGEARKQALGSLYNEVQAKVNEILGTKNTSTVSNQKSNETIANEVIQGKWDNGQTRKDRLTKAGYNYNEIQKLVNKKLK